MGVMIGLNEKVVIGMVGEVSGMPSVMFGLFRP